MKYVCLILVLAVVSACGGVSVPTASELDPRADAIVFFTDTGFVGVELPLPDDTPRWKANGPNGSIGVVIGSSTRIYQVDLSVPLGRDTGFPENDNGRLVSEFVTRFAPGASTFVRDVLTEAHAADAELDRQQASAGRKVQVVTFDYSGGAVWISVSAIQE